MHFGSFLSNDFEVLKREQIYLAKDFFTFPSRSKRIYLMISKNLTLLCTVCEIIAHPNDLPYELVTKKFCHPITPRAKPMHFVSSK